MGPVTDAASTLLALLAALDDPTRGGEVWDLHDPDALLPLGGGIVRVGDIPREAFAAAFEADAALSADLRPGKPRGPALRELRVEREGVVDGEGRRLAWLQATEARTGEAVRVALGLGPGGIGWATLAPRGVSWGWAEGQAQAVGDLAYGRGIYPRSWLDAAWQRLHGHARPPLQTLPEAAFACAGSSACCRVDWAIEVDAGFQAVIDAVAWDADHARLVGVKLPVLPTGKLEVKADDARCRFLDPDGRCAVHKALGRQIFPTCALFPCAFALTPDGVRFSTSGLCGSARAGLGPSLAERADDLYDRLAIAANPPLRTPVYRLAADQPVPWPAFRAAEAALLDALARDDLPFRQRLWRGGLALTSAAAGGAPVVPPDAPEVPVASPPEHLAVMRAFIGPWLAQLGLPPDLAIQPDAPLPEAALLARFLRNLHWSKVLSFHFDLSTSHTVAVAIWLLVLHLRAAHGRVPEAAWAQLGMMFMHGAGLRPYLADAPEARERRAMLADPAFALWLTGFPAGPPPAAG